MRDARLAYRPPVASLYDPALGFGLTLALCAGYGVRLGDRLLVPPAWRVPPLARASNRLAFRLHPGILTFGDGASCARQSLAGCKRFRDAGRRALYLARQTAGFDALARAQDPVEGTPA